MGSPIPAEKAEELIYYYIELKYLWLRGEVAKITYPLEAKARELGFGIRAAMDIIAHARRIGMVPHKKYTNCY